MKIGLAQINTIVGDFPGNEAKILGAYRRGAEAGLDLVLFPELAVAGYPPQDLLLRRRFLEQNQASLGPMTNRHVPPAANAPSPCRASGRFSKGTGSHVVPPSAV